MDAASATQWLGTLPEGLSRDHAVGAFVSATYRADAASALSWAETIGDADLRKTAALLAGRAWMTADAAAAGAWIERSSLDAAIKEALLAAR
jgi:hypothetical protein